MKHIITKDYPSNDETRVRVQVLWLLVQNGFCYASLLLKEVLASLTHFFIRQTLIEHCYCLAL
jgi:hypothetical protein